MGNNCIKNKENQLLKLKGGYPLITPQKQHSLEQFTYDMKLNLDSFDDDFYQKNYQINPQIEQNTLNTKLQENIDFVIEYPTISSQKTKNYLVQRNNSAPVQKMKKRSLISMNCSQFIAYEKPSLSNQKKGKSNSRSLSKNKQSHLIQKVEGKKPRKQSKNISNKVNKQFLYQKTTEQKIELSIQKKIDSWKSNQSIKILF